MAERYEKVDDNTLRSVRTDERSEEISISGLKVAQERRTRELAVLDAEYATKRACLLAKIAGLDTQLIEADKLGITERREDPENAPV